jgi:hypothetical protein
MKPFPLFYHKNKEKIIASKSNIFSKYNYNRNLKIHKVFSIFFYKKIYYPQYRNSQLLSTRDVQ